MLKIFPFSTYKTPSACTENHCWYPFHCPSPPTKHCPYAKLLCGRSVHCSSPPTQHCPYAQDGSVGIYSHTPPCQRPNQGAAGACAAAEGSAVSGAAAEM